MGGGVLVSVLALAISVAGAESPARRFLQDARVEIERRLERWESSERRSLEIVAQAERALQAEGTGANPSRAANARKAIEIARAAAQKARREREDDRRRLAAIDRALGWSDLPPRAAVAVLVRGSLTRQPRNGAVVAFDGSSPVLSGDRVTTGANSFAELMFQDGTMVHLDSNSIFTLQKDDTGASWYELLRGRLRSLVECAKDEARCPTFRSGINTLPVRGTDLTIQANEAGDVWVIVFEGVVEVRRQDAIGGALRVEAGQKVLLPAKSAPRRPEPIGEADKWWEHVPEPVS